MQPKKSMMMPVNPNSQRRYYPTRSPQSQPRSQRRREGVSRGTSVPNPTLPGTSSQSCSSEMPTGSPQGARGLGDSGNTTGGRGDQLAAGRSIRAVRFDFVLALYLVPSRKDLSGIRTDLWWQEEDYLQFRICALQEKKDAAAAAAAAAFARARRRREESVTILPTVA